MESSLLTNILLLSTDYTCPDMSKCPKTETHLFVEPVGVLTTLCFTAFPTNYCKIKGKYIYGLRGFVYATAYSW